MARYFFDVVVVNGEVLADPVGTEFDTLDAAVAECEQAAREILSHHARFGEPVGGLMVRVRDDRGTELREVPLLNVLRIV